MQRQQLRKYYSELFFALTFYTVQNYYSICVKGGRLGKNNRARITERFSLRRVFSQESKASQSSVGSDFGFFVTLPQKNSTSGPTFFIPIKFYPYKIRFGMPPSYGLLSRVI